HGVHATTGIPAHGPSTARHWHAHPRITHAWVHPHTRVHTHPGVHAHPAAAEAGRGVAVDGTLGDLVFQLVVTHLEDGAEPRVVDREELLDDELLALFARDLLDLGRVAAQYVGPGVGHGIVDVLQQLGPHVAEAEQVVDVLDLFALRPADTGH